MQRKLNEIRNSIDAIDDQVVPLLAKRIGLALEASRYKHTVAEVRGCNRVKIVLDSVAERARKVDGNVDAIVDIYAFIIQKLTEMQLQEKGMIQK
ncbi:chorismate mutase [Comamonas testosteroni]|uniref:chorismate mutase n=1 Tax=Comamonas testosteroni TaxID=285 RepID=UPI0015FB1CB4|nr:chorismate mutase [Comamonas testosteroni]